MLEEMTDEEDTITTDNRFKIGLNYSYFNKDMIRLKFDMFCSISHSIVITFGIPLNLIVIIVILSSRRLKKKPRNILFLGVITAGLFTLLTVMLELIANHHRNPEIFCKISGLGSGVAYTCFLMNLLLALLDRYLAITQPLLHRKIVTVKNVRIIQIIGAIVIFFVIKWPFIFGVVPFQCGFLPVEFKTIFLNQGILIVLCIIFYILVYFKTKRHTQPNRVLSVSFASNTRQQQPALPIRPDDDDQHQAAVSSKTDSNSDHHQPSSTIHQRTSSTSLQVHGGSRRMDIEATFTLLSGVSSLLIFSSPMLLAGFIDWGCRLILYDVEHHEQCATIMVSLPYLREILLYNLVYNPMMYMIRSREFSHTLNEKWMRIVHHCRRLQQFIFGIAHRNPMINMGHNADTLEQVPPTVTQL